MSSVVISGDTSGAITMSAPAVAGTNTLTLQAATATSSVNTLGTAVASTSGTSIDFTGLPSWIKRITVMLSGVSTNSTSNFLFQIGSGSVTTSGYASRATYFQSTALSGGNSTAGFIAGNFGAANTQSGAITLTLLASNTWVATGYLADSSSNATSIGGTSSALGGALDRVRITTVGGTDTFDAGSVNILYEG